jgi:5-methyltetrahydrofolate--homocysteine methyltransferase
MCNNHAIKTLFRKALCFGWRLPKAGRTRTLPPMHDAASVWNAGKDQDRTMMGATPEQAAAGLLEAGADVVGANCGQGIAGFVKICARLKAAAGGHPVWIKPNTGLPQIKDGKSVYATTAAEFAGHVPAVLEAGASFIGGCCGTSPEFIRELHKLLREKHNP